MHPGTFLIALQNHGGKQIIATAKEAAGPVEYRLELLGKRKNMNPNRSSLPELKSLPWSPGRGCAASPAGGRCPSGAGQGPSPAPGFCAPGCVSWKPYREKPKCDITEGGCLPPEVLFRFSPSST